MTADSRLVSPTSLMARVETSYKAFTSYSHAADGRQEPLWVDLRWAHDLDDLSLRNPRFRDAVADLAAKRCMTSPRTKS